MDKNWKRENKCACLNGKKVFFDWIKIENDKINDFFFSCLNEQRKRGQKYINHTKNILYQFKKRNLNLLFFKDKFFYCISWRPSLVWGGKVTWLISYDSVNLLTQLYATASGFTLCLILRAQTHFKLLIYSCFHTFFRVIVYKLLSFFSSLFYSYYFIKFKRPLSNFMFFSLF